MDKTSADIRSARHWRCRRIIIKSAILSLVGIVYALWLYAGGPGIPCIFYTATGLKCPACGITHMFLALLQLDFSEAWRANPAIFCLLPIFIIILIRIFAVYIKTGSLKPEKMISIILWILIIILILFGIVRNLPFQPFETYEGIIQKLFSLVK